MQNKLYSYGIYCKMSIHRVACGFISKNNLQWPKQWVCRVAHEGSQGAFYCLIARLFERIFAPVVTYRGKAMYAHFTDWFPVN